MQIIWEHSEPLTVRQVLDFAYPKSEKAYTTVQTLMNILADKGILKREKNGPLNYYAATSSREKFLKRSLSTVAKHMFDGSFGAMASYLVSSAKLSPEEIRELKKLLNKKQEKS
jgi:BlaI family transcriptional regulator, penicillinase repressor